MGMARIIRFNTGVIELARTLLRYYNEAGGRRTYIKYNRALGGSDWDMDGLA